MGGPMTILHLGCGTDIKPNATNVDQIAHDGVDEVVDLNEYPWPWQDDSVGKILAFHVFEHLENIEQALRECARILTPGGTLKLKLPVGLDSWADPDHKHQWEWRTPEFYCGARPWDVDVGLEVMHRDVDLWPVGADRPLTLLKRLKWWIREHETGQGPWMFNQQGSSGEFTVIFQKKP